MAKPIVKDDGSADMLNWECYVPGKEGVKEKASPANENDVHFYTCRFLDNLGWRCL